MKVECSAADLYLFGITTPFIMNVRNWDRCKKANSKTILLIWIAHEESSSG